MKRLFVGGGKTEQQIEGEGKRKIQERYRAAWGGEVTRRNGRSVGWLELFSLLEKLMYPLVLCRHRATTAKPKRSAIRFLSAIHTMRKYWLGARKYCFGAGNRGWDARRNAEQAVSLQPDLANARVAHVATLEAVHASALNADTGDQLFAMLQSRGYQFVTLTDALHDPAYATPDTYIGSEGFSSILRWAEGEKLLMAPRPPEPAVIRNLYEHIAGN